MDERSLVPQPLTAEAFAAYGDVVTSAQRDGRSVNAGTSVRVEMPEPDLLAHGGRPSLSVFRASAVRLPFEVRELERHRLGSQTFLPLGGTPFLVVVALGDDAPDVATIAAFRVDGTRGVTFRKGVWHHPLLALADGDFAVLERQGTETDCEVASLEPGMRVTAQACPAVSP
ncbi:MAG: ureidoglycolate hydrolase [Burkholderiales bacterium]|nr:MAG: ureidoglycolate hydrolase [Burkholderiales bacterium]